ncbi:phage protease [Paracoccus yeei]|uniref:phage protease n=1 Tax=Paracoccus yeei TaxID=147645 RepID=UPI0028D87513|nr:phage protease [Paracoccus yeei]
MDLISSWCAEAELAAMPTAGQWVQLLPAGRFQGRDGRSFVLDNPQAVLAETAKRGELPIDYEHQMDDPATRPATGEVRAAGWIKQLEARDDGIWGLVEWTEKARNMIEAREYRYLSPVLHHYPDGRVVRVIGAGLEHRPNLVLKALSSEQPGAALSQVATALGLPAEADAAAILMAVNALKTPDPARYVPVEAVAELLKDRHQQVALMSEREAEAKVDTALNGGYITPAMVPWATALCRQDPKAFDGFLASSAPAWAHLFRPALNLQRPQTASRERADAAAEIAAQLGLPPDALD